ncbi:hypothetical protein [Streptomyces sp. NPDC003697]
MITRARNAHDIRPERAALLVIDMQDEFVRPGWSPYWVPAATRMAPRSHQLVEECRATTSVPVIWTIFDRGYKVVFGSDDTATDDESRQEPELAVLRKGFALVLTAEEITNRLTTATLT